MGFFPNVISVSCFFMKVESVAYRNTDIEAELWRILKKPVFYVIASFYIAFSGELRFSFWYDLGDCNAAEHYITQSSIMLYE